MFQGHSICTIDAKSRLILPAKFRKFIKPEAGNKLILTRGMDECLLVYPLDEWDKVKSGLSSYNQFNSNQRFFIRQFLNYVNECELDSQNRLLIPPQLMQFAKLNKEVIVLGLLDKMEIWDPKIKENYDKSMPESYEQIAEKVFELRNSINRN
ncbi:MAG: Transcriptional regulator MraZ [Ignavibacteria bacterium]|nr:Transcriptional regulator MraZ [Ignavibacteria bacterium]